MTRKKNTNCVIVNHRKKKYSDLCGLTERLQDWQTRWYRLGNSRFGNSTFALANINNSRFGNSRLSLPNIENLGSRNWWFGVLKIETSTLENSIFVLTNIENSRFWDVRLLQTQSLKFEDVVCQILTIQGLEIQDLACQLLKTQDLEIQYLRWQIGNSRFQSSRFGSPILNT